MGNRAGVYGFWITTAGADASNPATPKSSFLVDTTQGSLSRMVYHAYISVLNYQYTDAYNDYYGLTISHGLGYVPIVQMSGNYWLTGATIFITSADVTFEVSYVKTASPPITVALTQGTFISIFRQKAPA